MGAREPETLVQAEKWELVKKNALRFGLCHKCAAQLAWAHQAGTGGFLSVNPPCATCAPLVDMLPRPRGGGWRTVRGSAQDPRNWPVRNLSDPDGVTVGGAPAEYTNAEQDSAHERIGRHRG